MDKFKYVVCIVPGAGDTFQQILYATFDFPALGDFTDTKENIVNEYVRKCNERLREKFGEVPEDVLGRLEWQTRFSQEFLCMPNITVLPYFTVYEFPVVDNPTELGF